MRILATGIPGNLRGKLDPDTNQASATKLNEQKAILGACRQTPPRCVATRQAEAELETERQRRQSAPSLGSVRFFLVIKRGFDGVVHHDEFR